MKLGRRNKQSKIDSPTHTEIYSSERILYLTNSLRFVPNTLGCQKYDRVDNYRIQGHNTQLTFSSQNHTREILRELEWNNSWFSFYENIFLTLKAYIYLTVCDRTANKRLTNITYNLFRGRNFFRLSNLFFVVYHFSAFCKKRKSIFRRRVRIKISIDFLNNFNLFKFTYS